MQIRRPAASLVLAVVLALSVSAPSLGQDIPAPVTTLSDGGRTASDGTRSLTVSAASGVQPGQRLTVTGKGYDTFKGVYVAFCVVPARNQAPTPCGGGADMDGSAGSSTWISSNPPPYAVGLTKPYGAGGTFTVQLDMDPAINASLDCRKVRSAVVTRNDHTRSSDRGQDVFVPISFGAVAPPTTTPPTTSPTTSPTTTGTQNPTASVPATTEPPGGATPTNDTAAGTPGSPTTAPSPGAPSTTGPATTTTTTLTPTTTTTTEPAGSGGADREDGDETAADDDEVASTALDVSSDVDGGGLVGPALAGVTLAGASAAVALTLLRRRRTAEAGSAVDPTDAP